MGAATHAVPQICLPLGADQFDNADAVAAAGLGVCLDPDDVEPDALASAITCLLGDRPTAAARHLADEIAAMPTPHERVPRVTATAGPGPSTSSAFWSNI